MAIYKTVKAPTAEVYQRDGRIHIVCEDETNGKTTAAIPNTSLLEEQVSIAKKTAEEAAEAALEAMERAGNSASVLDDSLEAAASSATAAATSASNAKTSETNAASSKTAAAASATNAKTSETNAAASATAAAASAKAAASAITGVKSLNSLQGDLSVGFDESSGDVYVEGESKTILGSVLNWFKANIATIKSAIGNATTSAAGLMTTTQVTKLNGIAEGANKTNIVNNLTATTAGSALDAVQGKALSDQISSLNSSVTSLSGNIAKKLDAQSLTADGGSLTFTDSSITTTSLIDVYATIPNIAPSAITASTGTCTVTFDAQDSAFDVCITVRN